MDVFVLFTGGVVWLGLVLLTVGCWYLVLMVIDRLSSGVVGWCVCLVVVLCFFNGWFDVT